ncbi:eCIS core domain-containing protein [Sorangium sp. So ce145]|uniref:eCIS core domain-containing protein n=1 Tax=Sorangium sp. So ce145 TaxID=3133285 RepID=UPI003F63B747
MEPEASRPITSCPSFDFTRIASVPPPIQRKATVSSPGDPFEREADEVADKVMRMAKPAPIGAAPVAIQRMCADCEEEKTLQTKRAPSADACATLNTGAAVREAERGGEPLPRAERDFFEPRFGYDFSRVRVHADAQAASSAKGLHARAYTFGSDIVFGAGEYAPQEEKGRRLLAHELTHVVQQHGSTPARVQRVSVEEEAKEGAEAAEEGAEAASKDEQPAAADVASIDEDVAPIDEIEEEIGGAEGAGEEEELAPEIEAPDTVAAPTPDAMASPGPGGKAAPQAPSPKKPAKGTIKACSSKTDPKSVIADHTVRPTRIDKPGDTVTFTVTFACQPVGEAQSILETTGGKNLGSNRFTGRKLKKFARKWNGKKLFTGVGTYVVNDGVYQHRLADCHFGYTNSGKTKLFAQGSKLVSPAVTVGARAFSGPGKSHFHFTSANVKALARIIDSEMKEGNATERTAIAWAVRNQMARLGTGSVATARAHFGDASGMAGSASAVAIAGAVLQLPMSNDITGGAIKWFSPKRMPKKGESCAGYDCGGGLITVSDLSGASKEVYGPAWIKSMTKASVSNTRPWLLILYAL